MTQEEALKAFEEMYSEIDKENWLFVGTINPQMVEHAIQVLSIVRCKDCRYWYMDIDEKCMASKSTPCTDENDFCSWAERKEE